MFHYTLNEKNESHVFASSLRDRKQHKAHELYMISRDLECPWRAVMKSPALISKLHCTLSANQKRVREFNV